MKTWLVLVSIAGLSTSAWAQDPTPNPSNAAPQGTLATSGNGSANSIRVGIQVDGAKITGDAADLFAFGFGFGARGGYELHFGDVLLTPELAVNYSRWGLSDMLQSAGGDAAWILGVLPGARVGYALGMATPWVGVHFGLDHGGGGNSGQSTDKFGMDFGAGADIALKSASIGPFVAYNIDFTDMQSLNWVSFGVGGSFGF